ncbi:MAG: NAD(P)-dependent oxidoreductase [Verrucomicrobiota bacterium]
MPHRLIEVYGNGRFAEIESLVDTYPVIIGPDNFDEHSVALSDVEFIFSTWHMPQLTELQMDELAALKAVFYAAGSVQYFARPYLERGIHVVSARMANAVPVAEYVVAQIILASKGYFSKERISRTFDGRCHSGPDYPGICDVTVSILGAGTIGAMVIERLKNLGFEILVFDPLISKQRARDLGVRKVSLAEAFSAGFIVSNHIADLPETRGILEGHLFELLGERATFINTGRGATVVESEMLDVLAKRPDLTALLDVTAPEPPIRSSPVYELNNVYLTPHIAGSIGNEVRLLADSVITEFKNYLLGKRFRASVTIDELEVMA